MSAVGHLDRQISHDVFALAQLARVQRLSVQGGGEPRCLPERLSGLCEVAEAEMEEKEMAAAVSEVNAEAIDDVADAEEIVEAAEEEA